MDTLDHLDSIARLDQQLKSLESLYIRHAQPPPPALGVTPDATTSSTTNPTNNTELPQLSPSPHPPLKSLLLNAPVLLPAHPFSVNPAAPSAPPPLSLSLTLPSGEGLQGGSSNITRHTGDAPFPGPPRSTWEAQRTQAMLDLEQQLHEMERRVGAKSARLSARAQADNNSSNTDGNDKNSSGNEKGVQGSGWNEGEVKISGDKENCNPTVGVRSTLRPSSLQQPTHFYPPASQSQQASSSNAYSSRPPLQAVPQQPEQSAPPPWEVGKVLGPWEHRKGVALLALEQERNALASQLDSYSQLDQLHAQKMQEKLQQVHAQHAEALQSHEKKMKELQAEHELALATQAREMAEAQSLHAQALQAQSKKMQEVHAQHAKALMDASGETGNRLDRLSQSAASAYAARTIAKRLVRLLAWWRLESIRSRRLAWAERVWNSRTVEAFFLGWLGVWKREKAEAKRRPEARRELMCLALDAWTMHTQSSLRLQRLLLRHRQQRCRRLFAAWGEVIARWRYKRGLVARAEARHCKSMSRRVLSALASNVGWELECLKKIVAQRHAQQLQNVMEAWHTYVATEKLVEHVARRGRLKAVIGQWVRVMLTVAAAEEQAHIKAQVLLKRMQVDTLHAWNGAAALRAYRRHAEQKIAATARARLLRGVLLPWRLEVRVTAFAEGWKAHHISAFLQRWDAWGKRRRRLARLAGCAAARRLMEQMRAVLHEWRVLGAGRRAVLMGVDLNKMQASVVSMQSAVTSSNALAHAQHIHARASTAEVLLLREEAMRVGAVLAPLPLPDCTLPTAQTPQHSTPQTQGQSMNTAAGIGEGGWVSCPLTWRGLPLDQDQGVSETGHVKGVRARGRHAALWLSGVQLQARGGNGGHSQQSSQQRLQARDVSGSAQQAQQREGDLSGLQSENRGERDEELGEEALLIDGLVQPWDAGTIVPELSSVLLVFGGVSGETWLTDLQAITITRTESLSTKVSYEDVSLDTRLMPGNVLKPRRDCACCACGPSSFVAVGGFDGEQETMDMLVFEVSSTPHSNTLTASVESLQPRSMRGPTGRSHHTATYHASSRSILMFGGYSSAACGHLNELWVFSMDLMEWIQPDVAGDWPSARRGHIATATHDALYVHGGFDGQEHFSDVWRLQLNSWRWERLSLAGEAPPPCRGHAAALLHDRYIVVHGGFDGSRHLGRMHLLDLHVGLWSMLCAGGKPDDTPPPRAMHTLTAGGPCSCGLLLLGGCGPLGPLPGLHMLEATPAAAGIAQQQRMVGLADRLSRATLACGRLQARLAITEHDAAQGRQQLQAVQARCVTLAAQHNALREDATALRAAMEKERCKVTEAEAAVREAKLEAAAAGRRLQRARDGGHSVASAAQGLHCDLEDARTRISELEAQLQKAQTECTSALSFANQVTGERSLLHTQLASANNEVTLLRSLMSNLGEAYNKQQREQLELHSQQLERQHQEAEELKQGLKEVQAREAEQQAKQAQLQQQLDEVYADFQLLDNSHTDLEQRVAAAEAAQQRAEAEASQLRAAAQAARQQQQQSQQQPIQQEQTQQQPTHQMPQQQSQPQQQQIPQPQSPQQPQQQSKPQQQQQQPQQQQDPNLLMAADGGTLAPPQVHASVHELAQAHARAMSNELQLISMEKDYAALKGEVASLATALHKERGAAQASAQMAQGAVQHMHDMQLHYTKLIEKLEAKLHEAQIKQWASDNPPPTRSRNAQPRHTDPSSQPPLLLDNQPDAGKSCADDAEAVAVTEESNRGNAAEIAEDDDELLPGVKALLDMRHTLLGSSE